VTPVSDGGPVGYGGYQPPPTAPIGWTPGGFHPPPPFGQGPYTQPTAPRRRGFRRWWVFWESPDDQPRWARPALLLVTALAALAYAWGLDNAALEPFYAAAARSMSMSWHNFFFGAFDPSGTVTVDKLPGALWVQALAVRAFGVNTWTIVMPQVIEGILTVLVLYRAVRRLAGPFAGIVAALVLAASPVTVLLNRGNISDSLLILLLVLAADATSRAITTGHLRSLLLAGLWIGLAFQAKMTQAWLVLPALWLAYLIASPARGRRTGHVVLATVVTAVVSLSWMLVVTAVPTHDRPYVDGSRNDSEFSQVFDYNGISRFEHPSAFETSVGPLAAFLRVGIEKQTFLNASTATVGRSWDRLLSGPLGRDIGWLIPTALLSAVAVLVARRRQRRYDPVRACCILWGTWLVLHLVAFSDGSYLNSYYTAALAPAVAALCGVGLSSAFRSRIGWPADADRHTTGAVATGTDGPVIGGRGLGGPTGPGWISAALAGAAVTGSAAYAVFLIPTGTGVRPWLVPVVIAAAVAADALLLASVVRPPRGRTAGALALTLSALSLLLVPTVASATVVTSDQGPFDTPFEPASVMEVTGTHPRQAQANADYTVRTFEQIAQASKTSILFMTDTSAVAAIYIFASGREVLPIGGFTGAIPEPTLRQIRTDIADGDVGLAVVPVVPPGHDPRIVWIRRHCRVIRIDPPAPVRFGVYDCPRRDQREAATAGAPGAGASQPDG
jgi:4-amino-4-deoxy-L-arabinose transferase-like glycosyltransferase